MSIGPSVVSRFKQLWFCLVQIDIHQHMSESEESSVQGESNMWSRFSPCSTTSSWRTLLGFVLMTAPMGRGIINHGEVHMLQACLDEFASTSNGVSGNTSDTVCYLPEHRASDSPPCRSARCRTSVFRHRHTWRSLVSSGAVDEDQWHAA